MKMSVMNKAVAVIATCGLLTAIGAPARAISVSIPVGLTEGFSDDAEEQTVASDSSSKVPGWVGINSSDVEMGQEDAGGAANGCMEGVPCEAANPMIAGFRFLDIPIPNGAAVSDAWIQFTVKQPDKNDFAANFKITGELTPNAVTFEQSPDGMGTFNISSRTRTSNTVDWTPDPWLATGDAGPAQRTPNISSLVQEIVNQDLWAAGNAMVFIVDGTRFDGFEGNRTTYSQRDNPARPAAVLHLEFVPEPCALTLALVGTMALASGRRSRSSGV